jgi:2-polyprenyl-6-hydroxyphenyl methylase/3-demethylubiquinone-9 3-methyltransferase
MATQNAILQHVDFLKSVIPPGDWHDHGFLHTHAQRFAYFLNKLQSWVPPKRDGGTNILEIGSYHLHLSVLMTRMGYSVKGVDLPVFVNRPVVASRAVEFAIENRPYGLDEFGKPVRIPYCDSSIDVVVCTEVLEHITFNPVALWSEVYRVMREDALLLLTTPNSFSLFNTMSQLKRLLTFQCLGPDVEAILNQVTSGHHWKEYSLPEIREYFSKISPDFQCRGHEFYCYRDYSQSKLLYRTLYFLQERILPKRFRSELFVVLRAAKKEGVRLSDPDVAITPA